MSTTNDNDSVSSMANLYDLQILQNFMVNYDLIKRRCSVNVCDSMLITPVALITLYQTVNINNFHIIVFAINTILHRVYLMRFNIVSSWSILQASIATQIHVSFSHTLTLTLRTLYAKCYGKIFWITALVISVRYMWACLFFGDLKSLSHSSFLLFPTKFYASSCGTEWNF